MNPKNIVYDICRLYITENAETLGPERSALLIGMVRSRDARGLAGCQSLCKELDSQHSFLLFKTLRQISAFFKKNRSLANPVDCEISAWMAFDQSERSCAETNDRLDAGLDNGFMPYGTDIAKMQQYIAGVLGEEKKFIDNLPSLIRVTSGATSTRSRRESMPHLKVAARIITCGIRARPYVAALAKWFGYSEPTFLGSDDNRVAFVPKSLTTFRGIACEPDGQLPLQLAFDSYVKRRFLRFGVDLGDQTLNQELARIGSIDGSYATIDLQAASDSLSFNAVSLLFPYGWLKYLIDMRSSSYNGGHRYSKFSSMGNGATFVMETLVFAAACHAVGSKYYNVYGDDIVIEPEYVNRLTALLAYLGFTVNRDKSFDSGPFRESCGRDWFHGKDVTPFYIRCVPSRKSEWAHLVNGLVQVSRPYGLLEDFLINIVRKNNLLLVPFNDVSTSGVWISCSDAYRSKVIRMSYSKSRPTWILTYKAYVAKTKKVKLRPAFGGAASFLWHLQSQRRRGSVNARLFSQALQRQLGPDINRRQIFDDFGGTLESSSVPGFTYRVRKTRVCWFPPARMATLRLHSWSERIVRE